jgi:hypothetical protein
MCAVELCMCNLAEATHVILTQQPACVCFSEYTIAGQQIVSHFASIQSPPVFTGSQDSLHPFHLEFLPPKPGPTRPFADAFKCHGPLEQSQEEGQKMQKASPMASARVGAILLLLKTAAIKLLPIARMLISILDVQLL